MDCWPLLGQLLADATDQSIGYCCRQPCFGSAAAR